MSPPEQPERDPAVRTLAICCEGFPALAAGRGGHTALAVMCANRVISATPAARFEGVRAGMRKREAQSACPRLEIVEADAQRDMAANESVMSALESLAPRWEVGEPGRCAVRARGPSRLFGGELPTARRVLELVRSSLRKVSVTVGGFDHGVGVAIADGPRAAAVFAERAALAAAGESVVVIPAGETAEHLADMPVHWLSCGGGPWSSPEETARLVEVLGKLGLATLGCFAQLETSDVLSRFGRSGLLAHDFARGAESEPVYPSDLPVDLGVSAGFDPPAENVEQVAFMTRTIATEMQSNLATRGLVCSRVLVVAVTTDGERIERLWRDDGSLDASGVAQRARWQLQGWLDRRPQGPDTEGAGVVSVELHAEQVVPDDGHQMDLWGEQETTPERVEHGVARLVAMLSPDAVTVPRRHGGRSPAERYRSVPFGAPGASGASLSGAPWPGASLSGAPWPGALPRPSPALVWSEPAPVELLDAHGAPVAVNGRGFLSEAPVSLMWHPGAVEELLGWAGPWCVDERWWNAVGHRRRARLQVLVASGAHLVTLEHGQWRIEATYD